MTKLDLIEELERFNDDAQIMILVDGDDYEIGKVTAPMDVDDNQNLVETTGHAYLECEI